MTDRDWGLHRTDRPTTAVVHELAAGGFTTACCGRSIFDLPGNHRTVTDPDDVTCVPETKTERLARIRSQLDAGGISAWVGPNDIHRDIAWLVEQAELAPD